jgi:hypothetical protein
LENSYKKKISQWNKKKEVPSFVDIMVISLHKHKEICEPFFVYIIQMLITGALFRIKCYHKNILNNNTESYFLEQLDKFRQELKKIIDKNNLSLIKQRQCQYLMPIDDIINTVLDLHLCKNVKSMESINITRILYKCPNFENIIESLSQSELGNIIFQKFQELHKKVQDITKDITPIFNEKKYKETIEILDRQNVLFYHPRIFLIQFIAAVKLNDDKMVKQYFKLLNRNLGNIFTFYKIQANDFKKIIQNIDNLDECMEKISDFLKNVGN